MKTLVILSASLALWPLGSLIAAEPSAPVKTESAAPAKPVVPDWNVRDHVPLEKFIIQSHRGAGEVAEENTVEAFTMGWQMGTIPEGDIRMTKDGVIVTFHDGDFKRVVKDMPKELEGKGVKDLTWDELIQLDVGSWKGEAFKGRRVSKLSAAFAAMKGHPERQMYLDIKNVDFEKLAALVKEYGVEKQVIFASTNYDFHHQWKKLVPDSQTLLWMGGTEEKLTARIKELKKTKFADITQVQIHVRLKETPDADGPFTPSNKFLIETGKTLRKHQVLYQSLPWGATEGKVYQQLMDLGVESFATDHPLVTWQAVKDYYEKSKSPASNAK